MWRVDWQPDNRSVIWLNARLYPLSTVTPSILQTLDSCLSCAHRWPITVLCSQKKLAPNRTHIYNLSVFNYIYLWSLCSGQVPKKLKIAKVILVYKKGDAQMACNYRPISLLSIFDKLLEKVMTNRLSKHLEVNQILHKYQFGFRKNHSTSLQLWSM